MTQQTPTLGVSFYVKKYKAKEGTAPLYLRISVNGKNADTSLKRRIPVNIWLAKDDKIKGATPEIKQLNLYLEKVKLKIHHFYDDMVLHQKPVSAEILKEKFLGKDRSARTLLQLLKYHHDINHDVLAPGTMKNYVTTEAYLQRFLKFKFKREDIFLAELNYQFITDLEHYIRHYPIKKWDVCQGNGVAKHLERLKKMVTWSKKLGWIKDNPFENYQIKRKKVKRKKLQIPELISIEEQQFTNPKLVLVQDLFLFACYTGLSYADVAKLTKDDFLVANDGKLWIDTYRKKSEELSAVPVLNAAIVIMDKYKNDPRAIQNRTVFPPVSNQEVNRNLKIIGAVCGITKDMNFHLARHTFATAVTLKNGVPIETVSKMLGHTKITTTQIYAEVDEEKIGADMSGVERRLNRRKKELHP